MDAKGKEGAQGNQFQLGRRFTAQRFPFLERRGLNMSSLYTANLPLMDERNSLNLG